ncbi:MAG TPA: glycosyltransferase [Candidatus Paceibacterota bacterium]
MINNPQQLVSVIISAYNVEKYISQAIESVIAQTYSHIEILIVNDGSTDSTLHIIEGYALKDKRVVVVTQENQGVSAARNTGFKIAQGDYFCIFDADDIMLPTKIEAQLRFSNSNPSADFIYSKAYYFIDGTNDIYRHDLTTANGSSVHKKLLQYGNFIYTGTVFFKRSVFDIHSGFDEHFRSAEEFDYWLTLSKKGVSFLSHNEYLTLCRSRGSGLTSDSITMYTTLIAVLEKHFAESSFLSKITSRQYIKAKFLLYVSRIKKSKTAPGEVRTHTSGSASIGYYVNALFGLAKKIKYSMTFKKIHDKKLEDFLIRMESIKSL